MIKNYTFLFFTMIPTITITSSNWFERIETHLDHSQIIIIAHQTNHNENIEGRIDLMQKSDGTLLVIFQSKTQTLGHFPGIKIKSDLAYSTWYDDDNRTVTFHIPYRNLT